MYKVTCLICNYSCGLNYLGTHLKKTHSTSLKNYYDEYLKEEGDGRCKMCAESTKFISLKIGYRKTCSASCAHKCRSQRLYEEHGVTNQFQLKKVKEKSKKTLLDKYGVGNISELAETKEKKKATCLLNYGVEHPLQSKAIRDKAIDTIREKYCNPNAVNIGQIASVKAQIRKTKKERYGDEHYTNRQKAEETMLHRYGTKQIMDIDEYAEKASMNGGGRAKTRKYSTIFGDIINIQGSYEERFVKYCENNNYRVLNGPTIDYVFEGQKRKYRVDFEVEKGDNKVLVEIKSSYWYKEHQKQVEAKKKYAEAYCKKKNLSYQLLVERFSLHD